MRRHNVLLVAALALPLLLLTPSPSEAQRGRDGRGAARVGRPAAAARPVAGRAVGVGERSARARPVHYGRRTYDGYSRYRYYGYPYYYGYGYYSWWPAYGYWGYPWYPSYGGYYSGYDYASRVRLQVTPKHAEVYVDGFRAGIADDFDGVFQRLRLEPGAHEIVVYLEGHRSIRHHLYLTPGDEYKIREVMQPISAGEQAEAQPKPTQLPDTARRVRAPYSGTRYPDRPRVRERDIPEYAPPGAPEPEETAPPDRVPPPERAPRHGASAWASPVAEGFGSIVVRVQPPDAEVYIDGERWRKPDGTDEVTVQLAAGPHRVEVRTAGFRTFAADVTVVAGATEAVNVSLPPEP